MNYTIIDENNNKVGTFEMGPEPRLFNFGKKIAVVIGHDINSQGAYGDAGISEYKFNEKLMDEILRENPNENIRLFYRDETIGGYSSKMKDLHRRIDEWGADISLELHFNSFSNKNVTGHEVLYCSNSGKVYAKMLNDCYDEELPTSNRGIKRVTKKDRGGGFVCRGNSKAILAEPFFGAHQTDFIGGPKRQALKRAMVKFFGMI